MAGDAESVVQVIERAFPRRPYSPEIDSCLKREDQSPESRDAGRFLIGKAWHEILCHDFECNYPCPFMIDPIALQYYFPGLLRCAVWNPDSTLADTLIPFQLLPPKREVKFLEFVSRYAWMTFEQRGAVIEYLQFFRDVIVSDNQRRRRQIDDAIKRFWGRV